MADQNLDVFTPSPLRSSIPRLFLRVAIIIAFTWAAYAGFDWVTSQVMRLEGTAQSGVMFGLMILVLACYALLIAIPFMPGIEVGVALLLIQGATVAPFVYIATVVGLFLAFAIGQFVPIRWLHSFFRDLRLKRACLWIERIEQRSRTERLAALAARLPGWLSWVAVKYRYISLGLLLNLPGSFAIGGGGGIMMMAGLSRLFHTGWTLVTLALAVLPVPLIVWFFGADILN